MHTKFKIIIRNLISVKGDTGHLNFQKISFWNLFHSIFFNYFSTTYKKEPLTFSVINTYRRRIQLKTRRYCNFKVRIDRLINLEFASTVTFRLQVFKLLVKKINKYAFLYSIHTKYQKKN